MAILTLGKSKCSICHKVLEKGQEIVATTHFIADSADPLWVFSDSGMHAECFAGWEHKNEFATRYHAVMGCALKSWIPAVPVNSDAPSLPISNLAVMGTPEERDEFFATIRVLGPQNNKPNDTTL